MTDEVEVKEETMEETLANTLAEIKEREGADVLTKEPAPAVETADAARRDEKGRFAEKAVAAQETSPPPEPADPLANAPSSWKPAAKAIWANLPPEVREEAHRREQDYFKGYEQVKPDAELGKQIRTAAEPFRQMFEAEGGNPAGAFGDYLRTAAILRTGTPEQKRQIVNRLEQQFNIPPKEQQGEVYIPPEVQQVQTELQRIQQAQRDLQNQWQQRIQQEQQQKEQQATTVVAQWETATDSNGNLLRPYVNNVMDELLPKITNIRVAKPNLNHEQVLQEAYDRAIWENPETRKQLLAAQTSQAQHRQANLRTVRGAKQAASVNVPRKGALPATQPLGTMDDTLRDTLAEIKGR